MSDEVTSTTSLVSQACGGVGSVRVLPQKCRGILVRHPFGGICVVSSWGYLRPMCQEERAAVFLRPSRVAHVAHIPAARL